MAILWGFCHWISGQTGTKSSHIGLYRYSSVEHQSRHIVGHLRDDLPSQSLYVISETIFPASHLIGVLKSHLAATSKTTIATID